MTKRALPTVTLVAVLVAAALLAALATGCSLTDNADQARDAVRTRIKWKHLFVVRDLKVQGLWAYAELEQTDPADPGQKYESFAAVCRQTSGSWVCLEALGGSDAADIEAMSGASLKQWLKDKYPAAPAAIFK